MQVMHGANPPILEGRPNPDRTWTECFAQLVGTVLSLWDASELDTAGEEGEVLPKFINLTDATIKMVCIIMNGQHVLCEVHDHDPATSEEFRTET